MRGDSLKLKLARIALAYAIALQALLGAFAGPALAAASQSFDPSLSLCRTVASGEAQPSDDHTGLASHCAAMCLSGACSAGEPPLAASVTVEFPQSLAAAVSVPAAGDGFTPATAGSGLKARGPPSIG